MAPTSRPTSETRGGLLLAYNRFVKQSEKRGKPEAGFLYRMQEAIDNGVITSDDSEFSKALSHLTRNDNKKARRVRKERKRREKQTQKEAERSCNDSEEGDVNNAAMSTPPAVSKKRAGVHRKEVDPSDLIACPTPPTSAMAPSIKPTYETRGGLLLAYHRFEKQSANQGKPEAGFLYRLKEAIDNGVITSNDTAFSKALSHLDRDDTKKARRERND